MKRNKNALIKEFFLVLLCTSALVGFIFWGLNVYTAGWHLVDDHRNFDLYSQYANQHRSFFNIMRQLLKDDFSGQHRDRLLHYPYRLFESVAFGLNYEKYYLIRAITTIITLITLYYSVRILGLNCYMSSVFALISFCGPQCGVWYKFGTTQLQATTMFAFWLLFMIMFFYSKRKFHAIISIVFCILMTGFHEGFILIIPAMMLFLPHLELAKNNEPDSNGRSTARSLIVAFKKWLPYELSLLIIFTVHMIYILFFLSFTSYGTFFEENGSSPLSSAVHNTLASLKGDVFYYAFFTIVLTMVLLTFYDKFKTMWQEAVIFIFIVIPQFALYSQEGIYERYLLPLSFGFTFFFVVFTYKKNILTGKRKASYYAMLGLLTLLLVRKTIIEADYFRFRGNSVTTMLDNVVELQEKGYNVVNTLGIANPEAIYTTKCLLAALNLPDCYYWDEAQLKITSDVGQEISLDEADYIIVYNRDDRHFTIDTSIDYTGFNYVRCGSLDLYFSDKVYDTFTPEKLETFNIKPTIYGIGE